MEVGSATRPPDKTAFPTTRLQLRLHLQTHTATTTSAMASRKRSRNLDDVDGEVEIESARSSFRQSLPKRSRVTLAQQNGGSVVSDDEDEENGDYRDGDSQHGPAGGHSDNESEDDGIDELQATQIVQKQIRKPRDNIASEEGVIEEVFCRNFMCHSKLRIKLGPLINFIIGHNGSGKSAVLTALTMCLGGKATSTNRGVSLKSLIKEGEESATLAVKIKNQGSNAYKPDMYGKSITVERHFSRAGTSGFKLKNAEDKTITTKKADLDDMLDYFAFQLENPINVLTQDMARQFLSNSTPSDKYKFFIKGTQLESLDRDYQLIEEHLDSVERKLESRQDDVDVLKRKMDEAEQRKKRSEQTQRMQDKITELGMQHAWAQVQEQEEVLESSNQAVAEAEQVLDEKRRNAESDSALYDARDQAKQDAEQECDALKAERTPLQEKRDAEKEKFDANKKDLGEVKTQQRMMHQNMRQHKSRIEQTRKNIEEEQGRLAGAEGAEHAERMSRMEELKEAAEEATRAQMDHGKGFAELQGKKDEATKALDSAKPSLGEKRGRVKHAEGQLQRFKSQQPRPFEGYRQNMEQLVKAVNNETRWRSKPVGPMGKHVTLVQVKWSSQIESTFGMTLDGFVVTCKEDQALLSGLMRKVNCPVGIFIGDSTPLDTTGKEPDAEVDTILRMLRIDSDLVRNQFIINNAIDQTVLIEDLKQAREYMSGTTTAPHPPPRNVRASICITEGKSGTRFDSTRTGNMRSGFVKPWENPRIQVNREDREKSLQQDLQHAKRELDAAEKSFRELQNALTKAGQAVVRFERQQKELKVEIQRAEDAIEALQAEIDSNRPQDGKLQELESQLAEAKDDLESEERSYQDVVNSKDDLDAKAKDLKAVLDAAQAEFEQIEGRINRAEEKVKRATRARGDALHQKNLAFGLIDGAQRELDHLIGRRDTQQATVDQFIELATQVGGRVAIPPGRRQHQIDAEIKRLTDDMKRRQQEIGGSRQELTLAYQKARQEYTDARGQMQTMANVAKVRHPYSTFARAKANPFLQSLKSTLSNRHYRWKMFRKYISYRARFTFSYLLSERQFRGRVLMNHSTKELDINVEPDLSKVSDAGRQTKTLSGGEKSFSTICLLLSIWEAMGSPIRCLDEFDVFMDSVNRATSMTMMIQAARRSVGRQFILITPQSMNSVEMQEDVKVHKMSDPERGQTTLPY